MASAANALRLCLRTTSQTQSLRAPASAVVASTSRSFSATPAQCGKNYIDRLRKRRKNKEHGQNEVEYEYEQNFNNPGEYFDYVARESQKEYPKVSKEEVKLAETLRGDWDALQQDQRYELGQRRKTISAQAADLRRPVKAKRDSFWNEEEQDSEYITEEIGEDDFEEDDIMAMGHGKLEEHREFREYARIAVWEMPLLAQFAKKFEPPAQDQVLRFRYTSYMGEFHPADRKVVVEFCPTDIQGLTQVQREKLMKLAGPRYNPEKKVIKMSCERFEHQAQNKRYLGDLVQKMIEAAKDPTDTFADIPLDTRHHKFTVKPKFPKEWYLTPERKAQLEAERKEMMRIDQTKRLNGALVDGVLAIEAAKAAGMEAEAVMIPRGQAPPGRR
ncbi:mitochondrial ribosomal subunit protein-domain-containing protein [Cladorrhinum samala]|uniref:Mitochondrial ribosomal subunit protein-domain-containing protein n=1 Tax=Cladorrhinum samala TaxID=585594 RepID=A0AAV9I4G8_9PEZI|nr:mitochondrial ribosomal subunit protein-domain-containing protein [Cladorrhinum samala]